MNTFKGPLLNKKISVCHDLGLLKVWRGGEQQWWGLPTGSCEVHPVGDLAVLGSDWAKALCKAVRSLSKWSFFLWGRFGVGTRSICSTGEQYFGVPD